MNSLAKSASISRLVLLAAFAAAPNASAVEFPTRPIKLVVPYAAGGPTIAESGYPDYRVSVWYGIAAPSKLPDDIAVKISASLDRALNDDAFRASLEKIGFPVFRPRSAAAITEFIDADRARWSDVIRAQNIALD